MKPLSIIFDIDGVIVDSEQLHFDVLKTVLPKQTNNITPEKLIGLSLEETLSSIGIATDQYGEIKFQIVSAYKSLIGPRYLRPGITQLIEKLNQQKIPFGFVSTATRDICLANIAILGLELRQPLISCDDVDQTKPNPDPYLAMLELLQATPEHTIVIEDTDIGIKAATAAGIKRVYGWPHALSLTESYANAYKVIGSLNEIDELYDILNSNMK